MKKSSARTCFVVALCVGISCWIFSLSKLLAVDFSRALGTQVGLSWNEVPICDALNRLATQTKLPIWLDRRVDVYFSVSGTFQDATPAQILRELLTKVKADSDSKLDLELTRIDSALYVGPAEFAEHLRTLLALKREELKKAFSSATQKKWLSAHPLKWERGASPKEILTELCEERNVRISGLKRLPHDVWSEKTLPEISMLEAAVVILGQFGLTLEFADETATVAPLKLNLIHITRNYPKRVVSEEKKKAIVEDLPTTQFAEREKEKKIAVRGILEVHEFLEKSEARFPILGGFTPAQLGMYAGMEKSPNMGRTQTGIDRSLQRFSGTITAPFYPALKQLCAQQGMTLEADADALLNAGVDFEKIVTVKFQEATVEELFQQVAEAGGCAAEVRGDRVILRLLKK